ncbi:MAG TPA: hypothetical protein VKM69_03795, partial [Natronoarchaeum rubrum]|nr:hypothetical protein [Natronoarchaeum rubrum]
MSENAGGPPDDDRALRVGVDVGGTFTDVVLVDAAAGAASESGAGAAAESGAGAAADGDAEAARKKGRLVTAKVPTTDDQ